MVEVAGFAGVVGAKGGIEKVAMAPAQGTPDPVVVALVGPGAAFTGDVAAACGVAGPVDPGRDGDEADVATPEAGASNWAAATAGLAWTAPGTACPKGPAIGADVPGWFDDGAEVLVSGVPLDWEFAGDRPPLEASAAGATD
jgi:hypothetical protein